MRWYVFQNSSILTYFKLIFHFCTHWKPTCFTSIFHFFTPLKTSENLGFSDIFREYRNGLLVKNESNNLLLWLILSILLMSVFDKICCQFKGLLIFFSQDQMFIAELFVYMLWSPQLMHWYISLLKQQAVCSPVFRWCFLDSCRVFPRIEFLKCL